MLRFANRARYEVRLGVVANMTTRIEYLIVPGAGCRVHNGSHQKKRMGAGQHGENRMEAPRIVTRPLWTKRGCGTWPGRVWTVEAWEMTQTIGIGKWETQTLDS